MPPLFSRRQLDGGWARRLVILVRRKRRNTARPSAAIGAICERADSHPAESGAVTSSECLPVPEGVLLPTINSLPRSLIRRPAHCDQAQPAIRSRIAPSGMRRMDATIGGSATGWRFASGCDPTRPKITID